MGTRQSGQPIALEARPAPPGGVAQLVAGLGPHGERPTSPELLTLSEQTLEFARARSFRVALVLHTTSSDWAKRQVAGISAVLREAGATIVDVIDCSYDVAIQVAAIEQLILSRPDVVISIPVGSTAVADVFRKLSAGGTKVVLLDNAPSGLLQEIDYVGVVSCDNFGLGQIAANLLSPHIPRNGTVAMLAYHLDFFATAQREIAFSKWMRRERPDIALTQLKFERPEDAGKALSPFLDQHPLLDGLFVVWDEPAVACLPVMQSRESCPVMTTIDLGNAIAEALSDGRIVKGVAAQRPFEQGEIAATAAILALTGSTVPPWIVLPGLAVTSGNVCEAFAHVGGDPTTWALGLSGQ